MEIHIINESTDINLPVLPESFEVTDPMNNETATIHTFGEINLLGKQGLRTIEITSILPHKGNNYTFSNDADTKPETIISQFRTWKNDGDIIQLHVTDSNIQWNVTIEELKYGRDDATGDYNFTLSLKEYRTPKARVAKKVKVMIHTVKNGETLRKISSKYFGKTSYRDDIYNWNKKAIEKAFKKHQKALKKAGKPEIKSKTSKKGKYLYKGTKLIIKKNI